MPPKRQRSLSLTPTDSESEFEHPAPAPSCNKVTTGGGAGVTGALVGALSHWWLQPNQTIGSVLRGLSAFCQQSGLQCTPRVRSSDKFRATIACKQQGNGCPLRLTVKKSMIQRDYVTPNPGSFVCGSCITPGPSISRLRVIRYALDAQDALQSLSASFTPGIPANPTPVSGIVASSATASQSHSATFKPGTPGAPVTPGIGKFQKISRGSNLRRADARTTTVPVLDQKRACHPKPHCHP
jgi:hypothetical protein